MPKPALALALGLIAVVAAAGFVPFLTEDRPIPVTTAATTPVFSAPALVEVPPGERACLDDVLLDPDADIARFRVGTYGEDGPPLALTLAAPGYRERVAVGAGYADNAELGVPVEGPERELIGDACIANEGRVLIALYATAEGRTQSRVDVEVDGEPVPADVALTFFQREPESVAGRIPEALDAMTAFRPVGTWLTWPLFLLVALAMPALALWALHRAFAQDGEERPNAATSRSASPSTRG